MSPMGALMVDLFTTFIVFFFFGYGLVSFIDRWTR